MQQLSDLLDQPEFRHGFRHALPLLVVGAVLALAWWALRNRWRRRSAAPLWGLLLAAGFVDALPGVRDVPDDLRAALVLLALAGALNDTRRRLPLLLVAAAAVPGAWLAATSTLLDVRWTRVLVGAAIVVGGTLAGEFDRRWRVQGWGPLLMAGTILGVYVTVPDTEEALVLVGVGAALLVLAWPFPALRLGWGGALAATAVALWVAQFDARGRTSALVGSVACLGLLVVEPIARRLLGGRSPLEAVADRWVGTFAVVAAHGVLVFIGARVAGLQASPSKAAVTAVVELGLATGAVWYAGRALTQYD